MKKFVAFAAIFYIFILCSCTADTSGAVYELTRYSWSAQLDGGGRASLDFDGESAELVLANGCKTVVLSGKYAADDESLVIFSPSLLQNYRFDYTPRGEKLDLTFSGCTVTFEKNGESGE